ncbi:cyclase family protein [Ancylobacter sonchi]|uniref:cyclase family protein n=1 Tax=Ancylobacter sonchi TaxID=1937790 RepID=UPI001FEA2BE7|nr:cyclase family protein [Ancylobacter sonchi]
MTSSAVHTSQTHLTMNDIREAAERLKNWNKWGANDEIGTLNYTSAADIISAASLVRKGKVFSLAINLDNNGPQGGKTKFPPVGRFNPVHTMLRTGTDAYSGVLDKRGIRSADDLVLLPLQAATHWDGLGHIFYNDYMWNGYDCREVSSFGAAKCGIEKTKEKMVGRGVLLDIARHLGVDWLEDGFAITNDILSACAADQGVEVRKGDYLLVRTGHMEAKWAAGSWDGYPGGDAPGLAFETLDWLQEKQVAAVATDTWGVEVRPNETSDANQPWHWICIPIMGLTMGEIFKLDELAKDCAEDATYEFMFVAPALPITGAVGSAINPIAIR